MNIISWWYRYRDVCMGPFEIRYWPTERQFPIVSVQ